MPKKLIIAIDGPAGSGKSTTARIIAKKLGYLYIDTGAMYRAVTLMGVRKNILNDPDSLIDSAGKMNLELETSEMKTIVRINGEDVTDEIRSLEVNKNVSQVSCLDGVRKILVKKQQEFGKNGGVVMEGRDISTVVFPDADVKIFITASIEQRADRRAKEFAANGKPLDVTQIKENILSRDKIDSGREVSPLTKSPEAVEVDTSNLTIDEQVNIILELIKTKAEQKGIKLNLN